MSLATRISNGGDVRREKDGLLPGWLYRGLNAFGFLSWAAAFVVGMIGFLPKLRAEMHGKQLDSWSGAAFVMPVFWLLIVGAVLFAIAKFYGKE